MIEFRWRILIVGIVQFVLLVVVGISLWFAGYMASREWNYYSNRTNSNITGHTIQERQCSYSCNCRRVNKHTTCSTCYYTCYDGLVSIRYIVANSTYDASLAKYDGVRNYADVDNDLKTYYPIGGTISIYYNTRNPKDFELKLKPDQDFYIAFFCMVALACAVVAIWGGIEIWHLCKKRGVISDIEMSIHPT